MRWITQFKQVEEPANKWKSMDVTLSLIKLLSIFAHLKYRNRAIHNNMMHHQAQTDNNIVLNGWTLSVIPFYSLLFTVGCLLDRSLAGGSMALKTMPG